MYFLEMSIKVHQDYNKISDSINSIVPDSSQACQAMAFMVRAINGKLKQVVVLNYFICTDYCRCSTLNKIKLKLFQKT